MATDPPSRLLCLGKHLTVEHAFSCSQGGFPSLRHNDRRDITANLLSEVCHNVAVEPDLQVLTGEQFQHRTANTEDGTRLMCLHRDSGGTSTRVHFST